MPAIIMLSHSFIKEDIKFVGGSKSTNNYLKLIKVNQIL